MAENLPDTNVGNIEYISKQNAVYSIIANADDLEQNGCIPYAQGARAMAIVVERMPPADVAPVVRGEWIHDGHHRRCDKCGTYFCNTDREGDAIPDNFCPHCGAKMDAQKEE